MISKCNVEYKKARTEFGERIKLISVRGLDKGLENQPLPLAFCSELGAIAEQGA